MKSSSTDKASLSSVHEVSLGGDIPADVRKPLAKLISDILDMDSSREQILAIGRLSASISLGCNRLVVLSRPGDFGGDECEIGSIRTALSNEELQEHWGEWMTSAIASGAMPDADSCFVQFLVGQGLAEEITDAETYLIED